MTESIIKVKPIVDAAEAAFAEHGDAAKDQNPYPSYSLMFDVWNKAIDEAALKAEAV